MSKSIAKLVLQLSRKSQLCIGDALKKYDITASEEPFFMAIKSRDGLTQEELTEAVGVDKAVTTRVIRSLEEKGFVKRTRDKSDRRSNHIFATKKLTKVGGEVLGELHEFNSRIADGIPEEKLAELYNMLELMDKNVAEILHNSRGNKGE
jgi:DNA-binding MarR family transcriptional regulator